MTPRPSQHFKDFRQSKSLSMLMAGWHFCLSALFRSSMASSGKRAGTMLESMTLASTYLGVRKPSVGGAPERVYDLGSFFADIFLLDDVEQEYRRVPVAGSDGFFQERRHLAGLASRPWRP